MMRTINAKFIDGKDGIRLLAIRNRRELVSNIDESGFVLTLRPTGERGEEIMETTYRITTDGEKQDDQIYLSHFGNGIIEVGDKNYESYLNKLKQAGLVN